ncbi:MAG: CoA-binding protein [Massilia sp.]
MKTITHILSDAKTVAVVGLSPRPERASHHVATYLQAQGYTVLPVNPEYAGQTILGAPVHATLEAAARALPAGARIDIVDCFRRSEHMPAIAREAIAIGAGCLWMQLDIDSQQAADLAAAAGLDVVSDHCMKVEHARLRHGA